jgi:O-antigen/teichoic acid export membrane protein
VLTALRLFARLRPHSRPAAWAVADQGINPLVQLVLTPALLSTLGRNDFGLWMLALTIINMSQLISLAAGVAATKHVSADLGLRKSAQAVAAIRAALAAATIGGAVAAVVAWKLAGVAAVTLFHNMGPASVVAPILALCGLGAAVQEVDNVFVGAMRGAQRFDLCAQVEVPARLVMGCVLLVASSLQVGLHTLLVCLIGMMAAKAAAKGLRVAALFGTAACCFPSLSRAPLLRVAGFGVWQWLQTAGTVFFSAADQLLIGGLLGAGALARYSVCLQIGQYVHLLPSVMMQIVFPRLSALGPRIEPERGNEILRSATLVAVGTAALLGLPLILLARRLLTVWIGADFAAANQWLLIVLVAVHITLAFNIAPYFVLLGSGRAARSAAIVLTAGAAQFALAFVAAPFGILAVACTRFV